MATWDTMSAQTPRVGFLPALLSFHLAVQFPLSAAKAMTTDYLRMEELEHKKVAMLYASP